MTSLTITAIFLTVDTLKTIPFSETEDSGMIVDKLITF